MPGSHRGFGRKIWNPMAAAGARGPARWFPSSYRRGRGRRSPGVGKNGRRKIAATRRRLDPAGSLWDTRGGTAAALMMVTGKKPLAGIRILVTRARPQAAEFSHLLRRQGAMVVGIPLIEIVPPRSFQPLDDALKNLAHYQWLIVTSVNGAQAMLERMRRQR